MGESIQKIWQGLRRFIIEPMQIYDVLAASDTLEKRDSRDRIGLTKNNDFFLPSMRE